MGWDNKAEHARDRWFVKLGSGCIEAISGAEAGGGKKGGGSTSIILIREQYRITVVHKSARWRRHSRRDPSPSNSRGWKDLKRVVRGSDQRNGSQKNTMIGGRWHEPRQAAPSTLYACASLMMLLAILPLWSCDQKLTRTSHPGRGPVVSNLVSILLVYAYKKLDISSFKKPTLMISMLIIIEITQSHGIW